MSEKQQPILPHLKKMTVFGKDIDGLVSVGRYPCAQGPSQVSLKLGCMTFLGSWYFCLDGPPSPLKTKLKIVVYNCDGIKMDILVVNVKTFFFDLRILFLLILKDVTIFLWAPKYCGP